MSLKRSAVNLLSITARPARARLALGYVAQQLDAGPPQPGVVIGDPKVAVLVEPIIECLLAKARGNASAPVRERFQNLDVGATP